MDSETNSCKNENPGPIRFYGGERIAADPPCVESKGLIFQPFLFSLEAPDRRYLQPSRLSKNSICLGSIQCSEGVERQQGAVVYCTEVEN